MKILLAGSEGVDHNIPLVSASKGSVQPKAGVEMALLWTPEEEGSRLSIEITESESSTAVNVALDLGDQVQDQDALFSALAIPLDRVMKSQADDECDDLVSRAIAEIAGNEVGVELDGDYLRFCLILEQRPVPKFLGRIELERVRRFFDVP